MPARSATLGHRVHPGRRPGAVLVLTSLIILSLTFFLGLLVGRHWAPGHEKERRPAHSAARGLKDRDVGKPPQIQEKLTFYQTLTAPLAPAPPRRGRGPAEAKPPTLTEPEPAVPAKNEPPTSEGPAGALSGGAAGRAPTQAQGAPGRPTRSRGYPAWVPVRPAQSDGGRFGRGATPPSEGKAPGEGVAVHPWTVQVAAYRSRDQAEALQRSLAAAGYHAYVTTATGQDGSVRYRVRVGSYPNRSEAEKVSQRLGSERALTPFLAPR
ncbi:MAG: SPOR domain-containing protein [Candidatus Rokubacteria bacterium]|nr:SPOR domain-containing protein [Candidatus Rokubacteria bacterium]